MSDTPAAELELVKDIEAYVYHCSDGDTCRVRIGDALWVNVRLAGIDAPEVARGRKKSGQPLGDVAKAYLNAHVEGQTVRLRQNDLDHFNRPVVELVMGGEQVNVKMVEIGYAEAYRGKAKRLDRAPYLEAEARAKAAKRGIWALPNYLSPARYRATNKR
jgi:micrococcal nuclease